jgi:hypothetical protein
MLFELGQRMDHIRLEHRIVLDGLTKKMSDLIKIARMFAWFIKYPLFIKILLLTNRAYPHFTIEWLLDSSKVPSHIEFWFL